MTKQKLKDAALQLFIEHGYEGTSIAKLVKQVEIRKSSFYAHFDSKADLFLAVYKDAVEKENLRISEVEKVFQELPPIEQLEKMYRSVADPSLGGKETHFLHRMLFYPPVELQEEMQDIFSEMEHHVSDHIRNKLEQMDRNKLAIEDVLATFYALIDGLSIESHLYNKAEHQKRIDSTWKVFQQCIN